MSAACTYCGSDVERHDPVSVEETEDGDRVPAGQFCNYACLSAHIEEEELATGACCQWEPPEA
jgi:hypothetical protein